jgi:FkbM family methyltransferase
MKILACGVAVIEGDQAHAKWIEELGTIHHDIWFRDQILRHIKPGDVVVQGGANIGTLTRAMLDAGAKVVAFEPNRNAFECLQYNCPEAHSYLSALDEAEGWIKIHEVETNAGASWAEHTDDTHSNDVIYSNAIDYRESLKERRVSLLLLDIEGFEVRALLGAAQTIARCRPTIICEVNRGALERAGTSDDELARLLQAYGYIFTILQPDCKWGDDQFDILAIPA